MEHKVFTDKFPSLEVEEHCPIQKRIINNQEQEYAEHTQSLETIPDKDIIISNLDQQCSVHSELMEAISEKVSIISNQKHRCAEHSQLIEAIAEKIRMKYYQEQQCAEHSQLLETVAEKDRIINNLEQQCTKHSQTLETISMMQDKEQKSDNELKKATCAIESYKCEIKSLHSDKIRLSNDVRMHDLERDCSVQYDLLSKEIKHLFESVLDLGNFNHDSLHSVTDVIIPWLKNVSVTVSIVRAIKEKSEPTDYPKNKCIELQREREILIDKLKANLETFYSKLKLELLEALGSSNMASFQTLIELQDNVTLLTSELEEKCKMNTSLLNRIEDLRTCENKLSVENSNLNIHLESIKKELAEWQCRTQLAEDKLKELNNQLQDHKALKMVNEETQQMCSKKIESEWELKCVELHQNLEEMELKHEALENLVRELKEEKKNMMNHINSFEKDSFEKSNVIMQLEKNCNGLKEYKSQLEIYSNITTTKLHEVELELCDVQQKLAETERQAREARSELNANNQIILCENNEQKMTVLMMKENITTLKQSVQNIESCKKNLEEAVAKLKKKQHFEERAQFEQRRKEEAHVNDLTQLITVLKDEKKKLLQDITNLQSVVQAQSDEKVNADTLRAHIQDLAQSVKVLEDDKKQLLQEITNLQSMVQAQSDEKVNADTLRAHIQDLAQSVKVLEDDKKQLLQEITNLQSVIQVQSNETVNADTLRARIHNLAQSVNILEDDKKQLLQEIANLQSGFQVQSDKKINGDTLRARIQDLEQLVKVLDGDKKKLLQKITNLQSVISIQMNEKVNAHTLKACIQDLQQSVQTLETENKRLVQETKQQSTGKVTISSDEKMTKEHDLKAHVLELEQQVKEQSHEFQCLYLKNKMAYTLVKNLNRSIDEQKQRCQRLETERDELRCRLEDTISKCSCKSLAEEVNNLKKANSSLEKKMEGDNCEFQHKLKCLQQENTQLDNFVNVALRQQRYKMQDQEVQTDKFTAEYSLLGKSSEQTGDYLMMTKTDRIKKLEKDKELLKHLCRGRQKYILKLQGQLMSDSESRPPEGLEALNHIECDLEDLSLQHKGDTLTSRLKEKISTGLHLEQIYDIVTDGILEVEKKLNEAQLERDAALKKSREMDEEYVDMLKELSDERKRVNMGLEEIASLGTLVKTLEDDKEILLEEVIMLQSHIMVSNIPSKRTDIYHSYRKGVCKLDQSEQVLQLLTHLELKLESIGVWEKVNVITSKLRKELNRLLVENACTMATTQRLLEMEGKFTEMEKKLSKTEVEQDAALEKSSEIDEENEDMLNEIEYKCKGFGMGLEENASLQQTVQSLEDGKKGLLAEVNKLQSLEKVTIRRGKKIDEEHSLKARILELEQQVEDQSCRLVRLDLECEGAHNLAHDLNRSNDELRQSCEQLKEENIEHRRRCEHLVKEGTEFRRHCEHLEKKGAELRQHCEHLEKEGTELRRHCEQLEKEGTELRGHCEQLKQECNVLRSKLNIRDVDCSCKALAEVVYRLRLDQSCSKAMIHALKWQLERTDLPYQKNAEQLEHSSKLLKRKDNQLLRAKESITKLEAEQTRLRIICRDQGKRIKEMQSAEEKLQPNNLLEKESCSAVGKVKGNRLASTSKREAHDLNRLLVVNRTEKS